MGLSGDFCSPKCDTSGSCPSDVPSGDSATPTCALQTPFGAKYCALVCTPSDSLKNGANGECGTGTCQSIQGTGICTYAKADLLVAVQAVQVMGLSGDFCSPKCDTSGSCPSDVPSGDSA